MWAVLSLQGRHMIRSAWVPGRKLRPLSAGTSAPSSAGRKKKDCRYTGRRTSALGQFTPLGREIDAWLERRGDVVGLCDPERCRGVSHGWLLSAAIVVLLAAGGLWLRFFDAGEQQPRRRPGSFHWQPIRAIWAAAVSHPMPAKSLSPGTADDQDNYDIYVKVLDAETALRLTSDPAPDGFAAWSPDGRRSSIWTEQTPMEPALHRSILFRPSAGPNGESPSLFLSTITSRWQGSPGHRMGSGWHFRTWVLRTGRSVCMRSRPKPGKSAN